jgi:hypothetical protein
MDALAIATFMLAAATGLLVFFVWRQVRLQGKQLAASERPCVYPITPHKWLRHHGEQGRWLAFRNGGTGIARNVRGRIWWHVEGGEARLLGQTLGAGDHARLWLDGQKRIAPWFGAEGYVVYEDAGRSMAVALQVRARRSSSVGAALQMGPHVKARRPRGGVPARRMGGGEAARWSGARNFRLRHARRDFGVTFG